MLDVLYSEEDLGLGRTAVVSAIRIPQPPRGLWLWGHKVRNVCIHAQHKLTRNS